VERLAGADRYATMSAVVDEVFPSADFVAVASGQNFADALVSAPLAGIKGAPILITKQNLLQRDATAEVDRLKPSGAYIVGGPEAVTERAEEAVRLSGNGNTAVTRVAGKNRQSTSVAALHEARKAGSKSDTIIVVNGHDFADALSISSWAYATKSPMLLTTADGRLTQEEVDAIKADKFVKRVILVGGTSAVSDAVRSQLASDLAVERVGGANRYETSRKVAEFSVANGMSWSTVAVVTGRDYSDGLVAAALVGKNKGVLLLVDSADGPAIAAIRENAGKVSKLYVLGGEGAVSAPVESAVRTAAAG
jgi:putative cell wall-binding protein